MTAPATAFVTYLWHYVLARALYDELLWPLVGGHVVSPGPVIAAVAAVAAFALGRRSRRTRRRP